MTQTVLPFKLEVCDERMTSYGGLCLFGEFLHGFKLKDIIDRSLPLPGSGRGYPHWHYVMSSILLLHGGGRTLEDFRVLREDESFVDLGILDGVPSSESFGNWLRRIGGSSVHMDGLDTIHRCVTDRAFAMDDGTDYTLDIDAFEITAQKHEAQYSYKGNKGYMPMVGHIAELGGLVIAGDFREGNVAPATDNMEFIRKCFKALPAGKNIKYLRADSATYQADIINECDRNDMRYAIGAGLDGAVRKEITNIAESSWQKFHDREIAETVHSMEKTNKAFRLIVTRKPMQLSLFDDNTEQYHYHVIASNFKEEEKNTKQIVKWYRKRGEHSENRIKEQKNGFSMDYMPCGTFEANRIWFSLGCIAYNLFLIFKRHILPKEHLKCQIQTIRWKLYNTPAKIVETARSIFLKVKAAMIQIFHTIRQAIYRFSQAIQHT